MVCDEQMSNWGPQLPPSAPPSPLPIALCYSGQSVYPESSFLRHPCPDPGTCTHKKGQPGVGAASVHMALTGKEQPWTLPTVIRSLSLLPVPVLASFPILLRTPPITPGHFPSLIFIAGRQILHHLSYQENLPSKVNPPPHRRPHTGSQTQ